MMPRRRHLQRRHARTHAVPGKELEHRRLKPAGIIRLGKQGAFQVGKGECERCVTDALAVGYRSLDTAQAYFNE